MLVNDDGLTPTHGELVTCDMCGKTYKFFMWTMGSDKHLCGKCVNRRPQSCLGDIDAIDIDREHDIIHEETQEQDQRDFPRLNKQVSHRKQTHMSRSAIKKTQRRMDKQVIKRFKQKEGSAVDVTGLG